MFDIYSNVTETHPLVMVVKKSIETEKGISFCESVIRVCILTPESNTHTGETRISSTTPAQQSFLMSIGRRPIHTEYIKMDQRSLVYRLNNPANYRSSSTGVNKWCMYRSATHCSYPVGSVSTFACSRV